MAIGGSVVTTMFEDERRFDITVRYVPEARTDINAIGNTLVRTREGGRVPLSELAKLEVVTGASIIARRENRRQITVRTNIRGRDQEPFIQRESAHAGRAGAGPRPAAASQAASAPSSRLSEGFSGARPPAPERLVDRHEHRFDETALKRRQGWVVEVPGRTNTSLMFANVLADVSYV